MVRWQFSESWHSACDEEVCFKDLDRPSSWNIESR